jgi:hypothetical protein
MLFLWIHFSLMTPPSLKVERRTTLGVVEGAAEVLTVDVVVDEVVDVVDVEEVEGSRMARSMELIFGILLRLSLLLPLKDRLQFSGSNRCILQYRERSVVY